MLHLKLETDPRWAAIAEENIEEILTDHAWCEQKAATNAITIITHNSQYEDLVTDLLELAKEELEHFQMVHDIIKKRGYTLDRERKDSYVNELYKFMNRGGNHLQSMVDRLLFSAMIEARSCERFKMLSQHVQDPELSKFYYDLMVSEAGHYTLFIGFARKYGKDIDVDKRWQELVEFEGELIKSYGKSESIHG
ncbi:tRNA-(ms[2]io[6]A)-hydroxylase [Gelidibacter salicanalis]|uniref:tRNA-(Ms[2]io[6]A)-hydroxylase n=1 Tax=Gelidibacter salicanalis TaxID=291193 RepID=A0A934KXE0_9FLAO|nr:tRNA-(ms[2]io[6]A)-hydroxylase [Gelidibacter salicanalis]MBJ7882633.1 tRNA-(ms[2]io[6]A)-hydroxylase [Gelidibacter salicanalis]